MYTRDDIKLINTQRKAIHKRRYVDVDGNTYEGKPDGRLHLLSLTTLDSEKDIAERVEIEENDNWREEHDKEYADYKKEAKCFTLAMSIVL